MKEILSEGPGAEPAAVPAAEWSGGAAAHWLWARPSPGTLCSSCRVPGWTTWRSTSTTSSTGTSSARAEPTVSATGGRLLSGVLTFSLGPVAWSHSASRGTWSIRSVHRRTHRGRGEAPLGLPTLAGPRHAGVRSTSFRSPHCPAPLTWSSGRSQEFPGSRPRQTPQGGGLLGRRSVSPPPALGCPVGGVGDVPASSAGAHVVSWLLRSAGLRSGACGLCVQRKAGPACARSWVLGPSRGREAPPSAWDASARASGLALCGPLFWRARKRVTFSPFGVGLAPGSVETTRTE